MDIEKELYRLGRKKLEMPQKKRMKNALFSRIESHQKESWVLPFFSSWKKVVPDADWVGVARIRLLARIEANQPLRWLSWFRRVTASALVLLISVSAVLFSIDGRQPVSASDSNFLKVHSGKVEIKNAGSSDWQVVDQSFEFYPGDFVRTHEGAAVTLHFFDDSQLRLDENSLLLISNISSSPTFSQQAVIDASLHNGRAWVQALNVKDDFAGLSLSTRHALIDVINGSVDVKTNIFDDTEIRVLKRQAKVSALNTNERSVLTSQILNASEKAIFKNEIEDQGSDLLSSYADISLLTAEDREESWFLGNLEKDRINLAQLNEREWLRLQSATGYVPGDFLYPVKRAKERLSLMLSFSENDAAETQTNIANQRLSEAIVLIQQGRSEEAKQLLEEYSDLVEEINQKNLTDKEVRKKLSKKAVISHQKTVLATLPGDAEVNLVKKVLDETEEFLADTPEEKAGVRLKNAVDNLANVQDFVTNGDLDSAKKILTNHDLTIFEVLQIAENLEDEDLKRDLYGKVLETQSAQKKILEEIQLSLESKSSEASRVVELLLENANKKIETGIDTVVEVVKPQLPDVVIAEQTPLPIDEKVQAFVDKVNIYKSERGKSNQVERLLSENPTQAKSIEFLGQVKSQLDPSDHHLIDKKITELEEAIAKDKDREIRRKINKARGEYLRRIQEESNQPGI